MDSLSVDASVHLDAAGAQQSLEEADGRGESEEQMRLTCACARLSLSEQGNSSRDDLSRDGDAPWRYISR